jgi:GntR family transcriptional regulator
MVRSVGIVGTFTEVIMAALYQKIADDLRGRIFDGELGPGAKLPTERELMALYGVSRNTVRMAIAALANQGLVATQPGRGGGAFVQRRMVLTYYASQENSPGSEHSAEFGKIIRAQGAEPREEFSLAVLEATGPVAERLLVPEGSVVIRRRLSRSADNEPVSLQDSYYPEDLARDTRIMVPRSLAGGTLEELTQLGHAQVGYRDELTAGMPSLDEVEALKLNPGVPVLRHWRTTYSVDRPVRVTLTLFAADRNRLVYEGGDTSAANALLSTNLERDSPREQPA